MGFTIGSRGNVPRKTYEESNNNNDDDDDDDNNNNM
jgi:hypothetical protein